MVLCSVTGLSPFVDFCNCGIWPGQKCVYFPAVTWVIAFAIFTFSALQFGNVVFRSGAFFGRSVSAVGSRPAMVICFANDIGLGPFVDLCNCSI